MFKVGDKVRRKTGFLNQNGWPMGATEVVVSRVFKNLSGDDILEFDGVKSGGWMVKYFELATPPSIETRIAELRSELAKLEAEKVKQEEANFKNSRSIAVADWMRTGPHCDRYEVQEGGYLFKFSFERGA